MEQFLAQQAQQFRKFWRKDCTAPGSETALAREVIRRLEALGLVRSTGTGILPMPAIHRYRHELRSTSAPGADLNSTPA